MLDRNVQIIQGSILGDTSWFYASSHNHLSFTPTCHPHSSLTTSTAFLAATHHYSISPFNRNIGKSISDMSMEQIPNGLDLNSGTESAMAIANAKLALLSTDPDTDRDIPTVIRELDQRVEVVVAKAEAIPSTPDPNVSTHLTTIDLVLDGVESSDYSDSPSITNTEHPDIDSDSSFLCSLRKLRHQRREPLDQSQITAIARLLPSSDHYFPTANDPANVIDLPLSEQTSDQQLPPIDSDNLEDHNNWPPSDEVWGIEPRPSSPIALPQRPARKRRRQNMGQEFISNNNDVRTPIIPTHTSCLINTVTNDLTNHSGIFHDEELFAVDMTAPHQPGQPVTDPPCTQTELGQHLHNATSLGTDPVIPLVGRLAPEVLNTINKVLPQSTKSISLVPLSNRFAALSPLSEDAPVLITSSHLGTDSRDALQTVDRHHLSGDTPSDRVTAPASSDPLSGDTDSDLQNHFAKLTIGLDESNNRTVKFQEDTTTPKPVLAPAAAAMWRQSRSSLQTSMKAGVRSEWLSNLCQSDIATPWAAGLHPLPPYCREDQVLCKTSQYPKKGCSGDPAMHGSLPERSSNVQQPT